MPTNRTGRFVFALIVAVLLFVIGRNFYKRNLNDALCSAIYNNDLPAARSLLERGADPNTKGGVTNSAALLTAVRNGNTETTRFLLDKGADTRLIQPPVSLASEALTYNDMPDLINLLLERRLITLTGDSQQSLLGLAASRNEWNTVRLLLAKGAFPNHMKRESEGLNVLRNAARKGHNDIVRLLTDKGISINGRMKDQHTPLISAVARGHAEIGKRLLTKGTDATHKMKDGETLLPSRKQSPTQIGAEASRFDV